MSTLTETGMSVLLVYGAEIFPPRNGRPGIGVTVDARGTVLLEAVGYPDGPSANVAICKAAQTCLDADLQVSFTSRRNARLVRRKSC